MAGWGTIGNLTPDQEKCLVELKEELKKTSWYPEHPACWTSLYLLRFCRARNFTVKDVMAMLENDVSWRNSPLYEGALTPNQMRTSDVTPEMAKKLEHIQKHYQQAYHGIDKHGRPIFIDRLGAMDLGTILRGAEETDVIEKYVRDSEKQATYFLPCATLARGSVVETTTYIMDLKGLSFSSVSNQVVRRVVKQLVQIPQDHYPETMGVTYVVNAPRAFSLAWSAIKPMLNERTQQKINICNNVGRNSSNPLYKDCDMDQLPKFLGGDCECEGGCLSRHIGPWDKPEIKAKLDKLNFWEIQNEDFDMAKLLAKLEPAAEEPGAQAVEGAEEAAEGEPAEGEPAEPPAKQSVTFDTPDGFATPKGAAAPSTEAFPPVETESPGVRKSTPEEEFPDGNLPKMPEYYSQIAAGTLKFSEALARAKEEYEKLLQELSAMERAHEDSLCLWSKVQLEMTIKLTPYVINRAAKYYDNKLHKERCSEKVKECTLKFGEATKKFEEAMKKLRKCEKKFETCKDPEARMTIMWEVSQLSDQVTAFQQERDDFKGKCQQATGELQAAQALWSKCSGEHTFCTYNCSVVRSEEYYKTYAKHLKKIEVQMQTIESMELRLKEAKYVFRKIREEMRDSLQSKTSQAEGDFDKRPSTPEDPDDALPTRENNNDAYLLSDAVKLAQMENNDGFESCDEPESDG